MNHISQRPLSLDGLRSFVAVARRLSFRAAAEDMHLTQPAISRQIKSLEDEVGAQLFNRGTRKVELTTAGHSLLHTVEPMLDRLDATVRQIRQSRSRHQVRITTFPSFASLWLMPRLPDFERAHPSVDIRISASDRLVDEDDIDLDLALRQCRAARAPATAQRLFGEVLSPVIGLGLARAIERGEAPPLSRPSDLADHTLLEMEDDTINSTELNWPTWLRAHDLGGLTPRRWFITNYTHQQMQAALAGQGVALAHLSLVHDALARGELIEPFGHSGRMTTDIAYWMVPLGGSQPRRPEIESFSTWIRACAQATRLAIGDHADEETLAHID
jgi:LysR family transcriptional regulator, glycine cleavage system transcriptional activator